MHMLAKTAARQFDRLATYQPGQCNIGPAEISRRRMAGHLSSIATLILLGILLVTDAPAWTRVLLFLPAAGAAAGYLQAVFRFCADYGWRGVFNFGETGHDRATAVAAIEARRADRRKAALIGLGSAAIGLGVALVALLL
jgi:hypothetical protein